MEEKFCDDVSDNSTFPQNLGYKYMNCDCTLVDVYEQTNKLYMRFCNCTFREAKSW